MYLKIVLFLSDFSGKVFKIAKNRWSSNSRSRAGGLRCPNLYRYHVAVLFFIFGSGLFRDFPVHFDSVPARFSATAKLKEREDS